MRTILMAVCLVLAIALVRENERAREAEAWAETVGEQAIELLEKAVLERR